MTAIRGGAGIGDALYVAALARHLLATGRGPLEVCTSYPDIFRQLPVRTAAFRRDRIDILAHYSQRKGYLTTTQWQDICITAGVAEPVELGLDWRVSSTTLVGRLRELAAGRPVVLVQLPRAPMGRTDGFGIELLPDCRVIQRAIDMLRGHALLVQIGAGRPLFHFSGIDVDLVDQTTITELVDLGRSADALLGYVSFIVPLAEVFDRPALLVWARRSLRCPVSYIRHITPAKILHKETSSHVVDDCRAADLEAACARLLLRA